MVVVRPFKLNNEYLHQVISYQFNSTINPRFQNVPNPITVEELRKIELDEENKWSSLSPEARKERIRLLQRAIAEGEFRISHIQQLEIRAYELATEEEKKLLREMDKEYPALLSLTKENPVVESPKDKLIANLVAQGKTREQAEKIAGSLF